VGGLDVLAIGECDVEAIVDWLYVGARVVGAEKMGCAARIRNEGI
jgi:hypothetical protein